jgi:hypothetical protein
MFDDSEAKPDKVRALTLSLSSADIDQSLVLCYAEGFVDEIDLADAHVGRLLDLQSELRPAGSLCPERSRSVVGFQLCATRLGAKHRCHRWPELRRATRQLILLGPSCWTGRRAAAAQTPAYESDSGSQR